MTPRAKRWATRWFPFLLALVVRQWACSAPPQAPKPPMADDDLEGWTIEIAPDSDRPATRQIQTP
jgi:hypothetical protein